MHPAAFGHEEHTGLKLDDDDETAGTHKMQKSGNGLPVCRILQ